jgi:hypothetical protein
MRGKFRAPYAREESQMFPTSPHEPGGYWWCRSCATKFRVLYSSADDSLTLDVYHDFGASSVVAMRNYAFLVKGRENSEFRGLSRTFKDFDCEEVVEVDDKESDDGERGVLLAVRRMLGDGEAVGEAHE